VRGREDPCVECSRFRLDTKGSVTSLIYAGVTLRLPNTRFIFSHGGGAVSLASSPSLESVRGL